MDEIRKIKRLVSYYARVHGTNDPFEIADRLGILYQIGNLKCEGCYMFLKNHRCIFLNENLSENEIRLVMAHELAHSILHRKENCYFIRNKTLLLTSKNEIEANTFAAELLIPDELIFDNPGMTDKQIAGIIGCDSKIMEFKKI